MGKDGKALRDATNEQIQAVRTLAKLLMKMYDLKPTDIIGHGELPLVNKSCPVMNMNLIRNF